MCGIHALISSGDPFAKCPSLTELLCNRGPDHLGQATRTLPSQDGQGPGVALSFTSTVLALRGDHVAKQPFEHPASGSVLCWNGEAWKIDGRPVSGNDGEEIFSLLTPSSRLHADQRRHHILTTLRSIQGPFAFLYYDAPGRHLYFGRDRLGRRSLLINKAAGPHAIALSSVADSRDPGWAEVQADGIYSMHLDATTIDALNYAREDWLTSGGADLVSAR
jgi:asparagine synthetase B (glutamine-hydrolysing)